MAGRPDAIPDGLHIRTTAREPETRSDVGIAVELVPAERPPAHRLVTIGDSLTHGYQSGAILNTDRSYAAIIAQTLGCQFRHPSYDGSGGDPLPANLELLIRTLEARYHDAISWFELPLAAITAREHVAQVERYWDAQDYSTDGPPMHNLGISGWDLRDALERTADTAGARVTPPNGFELLPQVVNADRISAGRVLGPGGEGLTMFGAAEALGRDGGIETLIVMLGANNALGSVVKLEPRWSGPGYDTLEGKRGYNVWLPEHFALEWARVAEAVRAIDARHVIFATVPHVTIAPLAHGLPERVRPDSRFYAYYTYPWVERFDPGSDPRLTADEARAIDSAVDDYNDTIVASVAAERRQGKDWRVLDLAGLLDRLAERRYIENPAARPPWWTPYVLPPELEALGLNSYFFRSGPGGRTAGGLFSLDGVHPTTVAYGLIAQELMRVMEEAGVAFGGAAEVDWTRLIALDSLISDPPRSIGADLGLIGFVEHQLDLVKRLLSVFG